jgi:cyclomaltodextrinase / maltogenic alpha-amylase / neopullulanase
MKNIKIFSVLLVVLSIQITAQNTSVPDWAKKAIWYQIFPERFCNGDKLNDPTPEAMKGAWPYFVPEGWQIHPWTSEWYKLQPWEIKTGKDFYWNSGVRRYGGDIQGILNKLDYLKNLGINAIYLTPMFESPSSHKYDATMYHHIDNNFGPDPKKDREIWSKENPGDPSTWQWTTADKLFLKLIQECHKRGMKIILDGVFNHTGTTFWAFQDIVKNQQNSKFKDWYTIQVWDDSSTGKKFDYEGWLGIKDLPRIHEDQNGLVTGPREHIHAIVKRWMDPNGDGNTNDGIDGWRLDVAEQVEHNFWKEFRIWVKEINPEAYIVGEIWWDDWKNYKMMDASPWLKGDEFDAVMNYRFARAVKNFVVNKKDQVKPQGFIDSINTLYKQYPKENNYVMMNLFDSHDVERVSSQLVNPDFLYDHGGNPSPTSNFDIRKPNAEEIQKQKLMVGIQFTLLGAPQIYYGDEVGMWGGDDPDCRKPMVWKEFKYETEVAHPLGHPRKPDEVNFNSDLFKWYQKIISIRNQNKVLAFGSINFNYVDDQNKILGYTREYKGEKIFILLNNSAEKKTITSTKIESLLNTKTMTDLVNRKRIDMNKNELTLNPYQIVICPMK